jgi:predicted metal-dependent HD superfamily phosphohydrolase
VIREEFIDSVKHYANQAQGELLWQEVEQAYSAKIRNYHTLVHLENLLTQLNPLQFQFKHWDTIVFAIVYHDVVYNVLKNNNEAKSADFAVKRLQSISFPVEQIKNCKKLILATQKHEPDDEEVNLFTDADLSVLGAEPEVYKLYTTQVRKEYGLYPDLIYNPGRKKVLQHFLAMPRIFKTDFFFEKYETAARRNLAWELEL